MAHTSEKRWRRNMFVPVTGIDDSAQEGVSSQISQICTEVRGSLVAGEEAYQQLQELYAYAGGTIQLLADQLFKEDWEARAETSANAAEVAITQDAFDAVTALHDLYLTATNQTVAAEDRLSQLRRMI